MEIDDEISSEGLHQFVPRTIT